jgi:hypothetical protein
MGEVNGPHQQPGVADGLVAEDERLGRSRPGGDLARGDAPHRAAPHSPAENAGAEAYLRLQDKKKPRPKARQFIREETPRKGRDVSDVSRACVYCATHKTASRKLLSRRENPGDPKNPQPNQHAAIGLYET